MSEPQPMTPRRAEVLWHIIECYEKRGRPPTLRELAAHFGWRSTNAATEHLRKLQRDGYVELHMASETLSACGIKVLRRPDGTAYQRPGLSDDERATLLQDVLPARFVTDGGVELRRVVWGQPMRDLAAALDGPRDEAIAHVQAALETAQ